MKKAVVTVIITVALLLAVPIALLAVGFLTPPQFDNTYYGELRFMYERLKTADDKKIVLVGNSSIAFGVRTDLLAAELPGYDVVGFGLYGSIGTKTMMDLSKANIQKDDIVILMPERGSQAQSLYFSAKNVWYAADGSFDILKRIPKSDRPSLVGNFPSFAADKFGCLTGGKPNVSGVYAQSSFDDPDGNEVGYMTYDRPYNIMIGGHDANASIEFHSSVSSEFIDYVNAYNDFIVDRGATLYYGFTPINTLALDDDTDAKVMNDYRDELDDALACRILGDPSDYIFDHEWFYDTDHHMNSAGMYAFTDRLAEDIKAELGISTPNWIVIPEKPTAPIVPPVDGDNSDEACFTYADTDGGVRITGLTEAGRAKTEVVIPATHDGKAVVSFDKTVFAGNTALSSVSIQQNLRIIYDGSFDGCRRLTGLYLYQPDPNMLGVGYDLLRGAPNCSVYVWSDVYDIYATHYTWGAYRDRIKRM